jgi:ABC-2 type transport system permease protein
MRKLLRSAFVIGRRDFTATVFSRAFLFFLLGPLFPILMGLIFGGIGASVSSAAERPVIAVVATDAEYRALAQARTSLSQAIDSVGLIGLYHAPPSGDPAAQRSRLLQSQKPPVIGVLEGGLDAPRLIGRLRPEANSVQQLELMIEHARLLRSAGPARGAALQLIQTERQAGSLAPARALTARAGQALLFLLTLLLSTMLLSQLIDEKSNKIIEVLAAAAPIEAVFLGKLFAMLCISLLGIAVWTAAGAAAVAALSSQGLSVLAPPAVGWPAFLLLALVYFASSYLLLGAVFLGIGAQASSAREVQTLSMPVTMVQVFIFAIAATAVGDPDGARSLFAAAFPLSSPYAMLARAAESPLLWPHLVAILWQALWVGVILAIGARMFRRSVLKSGPARPSRRRARV